MKEYILASVLIIFVFSFGLAQQGSSPWLTNTERAKFETLRIAGSEGLFNLDYEGARRSFKEMAQAFPNYPAGPQFLADSLWIETLYQTRRLQSSLYGGDDSFYSTSDDKADPAIVDQFRTLTRQARLLAEARLKQNPRDPEALYFLGAIEGLKASFEEAVERRHFAALKDGSDAVDRHREVIKLDPSYHDAELTIGLYDFTVDSLPLPVKLIAGVAGFRGSKKCRLEAADALVSQAALERAAHQNTTSASENEAFATFDSLLKDKAVRDTAARAFDLIHFKYGEALMTAGFYERAAKEFMAAAEVPGAQQELATMSHLYAARALDLAGQRTEGAAPNPG